MNQPNKEKYNDLGFGSKANNSNFRQLNKDGTFNVKKYNIPFIEKINFYHSLVSMPRFSFFLVIFCCYLIVNLIFASIYMVIGVEHLTGTVGSSTYDKFFEAFFFSSQTITTLGYGRIAPVGMLASTVAAIESLLGLLSFALATGMLYGRFSKPNAKIKYSNHAVIAPFQDFTGLMFRLINPQKNQLLEVEVSVTLSMKRENSDLIDFFLLDLERPNVVFLPSVWTIVHPITKNSPIYNLSKSDLLDKNLEIIVLLKAFDESFSQTVYSRTSYRASEIKWGEKFIYLIKQENEGISVDVSRIDETEKAVLPA